MKQGGSIMEGMNEMIKTVSNAMNNSASALGAPVGTSMGSAAKATKTALAASAAKSAKVAAKATIAAKTTNPANATAKMNYANPVSGKMIRGGKSQRKQPKKDKKKSKSLKKKVKNLAFI